MRTAFAVFALSAGTLLAGCGESTSSAPTNSPALHNAVAAYSSAYLSGRGGDAWKLLSARCRSRIPVEEMRSMTTEAKSMYGEQPIETFAIASLSDNMARVTYTYRTAEINQTQEPWVKEHGRWLEDDC